MGIYLDSDKMKLIWHGTASIEMESGGRRIIFDPFVPLKGSKVPVRIEDFDSFTDILVTHGHLDHICSIPYMTIPFRPSLCRWI